MLKSVVVPVIIVLMLSVSPSSSAMQGGESEYRLDLIAKATDGSYWEQNEIMSDRLPLDIVEDPFVEQKIKHLCLYCNFHPNDASKQSRCERAQSTWLSSK